MSDSIKASGEHKKFSDFTHKLKVSYSYNDIEQGLSRSMLCVCHYRMKSKSYLLATLCTIKIEVLVPSQ